MKSNFFIKFVMIVVMIADRTAQSATPRPSLWARGTNAVANTFRPIPRHLEPTKISQHVDNLKYHTKNIPQKAGRFKDVEATHEYTQEEQNRASLDQTKANLKNARNDIQKAIQVNKKQQKPLPSITKRLKELFKAFIKNGKANATLSRPSSAAFENELIKEFGDDIEPYLPSNNRRPAQPDKQPLQAAQKGSDTDTNTPQSNTLSADTHNHTPTKQTTTQPNGATKDSTQKKYSDDGDDGNTSADTKNTTEPSQKNTAKTTSKEIHKANLTSRDKFNKPKLDAHIEKNKLLQDKDFIPADGAKKPLQIKNTDNLEDDLNEFNSEIKKLTETKALTSTETQNLLKELHTRTASKSPVQGNEIDAYHNVLDLVMDKFKPSSSLQNENESKTTTTKLTNSDTKKLISDYYLTSIKEALGHPANPSSTTFQKAINSVEKNQYYKETDNFFSKHEKSSEPSEVLTTIANFKEKNAAFLKLKRQITNNIEKYPLLTAVTIAALAILIGNILNQILE